MQPCTCRAPQELFDAWDQLDAMAKAIQMTQAADMTEAARKLEVARRRMHAAITVFSR